LSVRLPGKRFQRIKQNREGNPLPVDRLKEGNQLRVLILTSPKAGSGRGRDEVPKLVERLNSLRVSCSMIDSIDEMRAQLSNHTGFTQTIVVAAGGDGTLSLAASLILESEGKEASRHPSELTCESEDLAKGLAEGSSASEEAAVEPASASNTLLLPMPLGTENLVAQEYRHGYHVDEVLAALRSGSVQETDIGECRERVFLIMASAGFDAEVIRWLHLTRRGHISRLTYLLPILRSLVSYRFPPLRVEVDGQPMESCAWAMAFNLSRYGGGLGIEPDADGADGLLDVILFRKAGIWNGLRYVWKIARRRHLTDPSVIRLRGKSVRIESEDRVPLQIDGDLNGQLPVQLSVVPQAISLLLPSKS